MAFVAGRESTPLPAAKGSLRAILDLFLARHVGVGVPIPVPNEPEAYTASCNLGTTAMERPVFH